MEQDLFELAEYRLIELVQVKDMVSLVFGGSGSIEIRSTLVLESKG